VLHSDDGELTSLRFEAGGEGADGVLSTSGKELLPLKDFWEDVGAHRIQRLALSSCEESDISRRRKDLGQD
jgi:hypothetical protein